MPSEALRKVIEIARAQPAGLRASPAERRIGLERISEHVARDVDCTGVDAAGVAAEWVVPPGSSSDRVIFYLHGGGYVVGSIKTHIAMVARIARAAKARALMIDYRLAPEHPFPAALDDAIASYRWLLGERYLPENIVIGGDSAGGGLALATLLKLRELGIALPAAGVVISPWADLEGTGASVETRAALDPMINPAHLAESARMYCATHSPKEPLISPIYADFRGIPPLLIQVGDSEVLLDDATRVAARARAAGVSVAFEIWPEMIHVWHIFAKILPAGQQAIDRIGQYILAHTRIKEPT